MSTSDSVAFRADSVTSAQPQTNTNTYNDFISMVYRGLQKGVGETFLLV